MIFAYQIIRTTRNSLQEVELRNDVLKLVPAASLSDPAITDGAVRKRIKVQ